MFFCTGTTSLQLARVDHSQLLPVNLSPIRMLYGRERLKYGVRRIFSRKRPSSRQRRPWQRRRRRRRKKKKKTRPLKWRVKPDRNPTYGNYVTVCVYEDDLLDVPDTQHPLPEYRTTAGKRKTGKKTNKKLKRKIILAVSELFGQFNIQLIKRSLHLTSNMSFFT